MRATQLLALTIGLACADSGHEPAAKSRTADTAEKLSRARNASDAVWQARPLTRAPDRFRPGAWTSETVLWGLVRGQVTRLDTETGAESSRAQTGWSFFPGRGVVSWRNARGTWMLRDGESAVLLAGPEPDARTGFDGPPTVLWSPDGSRALLAWSGEWDAQYELLNRDGSRRRLQVTTPGYFGNGAALWLDSTRVLFQTVAKAPIGGEPTYSESGWRGDLAVLDLRTGDYARVTSVADSIHLRVAGLHTSEVLVTEWDRNGLRDHWFYDPRTWRRRPAALPKGRAFASRAGAVVVLVDAGADSADALLVTHSDSTNLGRVSRDAEPVFSPSGRRGALRTGRGVIVFEPR